MIQKLTILLLFYLLVQSSCLKRRSSNIKTPSFYHNSTFAEQKISKIIRNHNNVKRRYCLKDGYNYSIVEISNIKSGKIGEGESKKLQAVVTCNVHSRQFFTAEVCLKFIQQLAQYEDDKLRNILDHINFRIFYLGNQMRDKAINGQFCLRTDKNGVDINRNFPTGFEGQKLGQQVNPGPKAISQPLSQCIQQQVNNLKPDIFLDVHTGQFSLYYTNSDQQSEQHHSNQNKVLSSIIQKVCANCRLRLQGLQGVIYVDMKVRKQVKWANLIQIYGGYQQSQGINSKDFCYVMFNPYDKEIFKYYRRRSTNILTEYFRSILQIQSQDKL